LRFLQEPALSLSKGWAVMLPVLFDLLRGCVIKPRLAPAFRLPPFAECAKDGAPTVLLGGKQDQKPGPPRLDHPL